jgi:glycosyltransferase involved in cell wall biosynthesis
MDTNDQPLVSILALCYNHEKFVIKALESIRNQSYKNIELFIIDDNSTDNCQNEIQGWIDRFNVQCHFIKHAQNRSICYSYNEFLALARGKYISSMATDDFYETDKIETQVNLFRSISEDYGVVYGDMRVIDEDGNITHGSFYRWYLDGKSPQSGNMISSYIQYNPVHVLGVLVKREIYDKVGPYDESLIFEDWDMGFRWARICKFYYHSDIVANYRKFSGQMTDTYWKDAKKYLKILDTKFKIYLKHLDLEDQVRELIIAQLRLVHNEMLQNEYFTTRDNISICKKLFKIQPTLDYLLLFCFSTVRNPILYFKLKHILSRLGSKLGTS